METPSHIKNGWEHRFPALDGKWTHWKIMGDGDVLEVVAGRDLIRALRVIEENYGKYSSITACRATVSESGGLEAQDKALFEISRFAYDEMQRGSGENEDA